MSTDRSETESRVTTDRDTIREWADEHDVVPVRTGGRRGLRLVPRGREASSHEELSWDKFFEAIEASGKVVVYHEATDAFEVVDRDEAVSRAELEGKTIEERLLEGETVTSEITETQVIERTVVEETTLESEIVEREAVEEEIVDAELLERRVGDCEVTGLETGDESVIDLDQFQEGYRSEDLEAHVEIEVEEAWMLTKELLERLTIESRVTETDATETDTVESDTVSSTVDVEGVQRSVVESNLVDTDADADRVVETTSVESEFDEGEAVLTTVVERKTIEEELGLTRRLAGDVTDAETVSVDSVHSEVVESALVDEEGEPVADVGVEDEATTATADEEMAATTAAGAVDEDVRTTPSEDDEGKPVVDATGERVGMVAEVEGTTLYVDPHPSLTDRIKAALDWGSLDEDDAYPVEPDRVARITDDEVELAVTEEH